MTNPLVGVHMITYNHGPYIGEAIEGVLAQVTDFPFELVIGEDCSTDGTRETVFDYQRRYPNLVRVVTSDSNVGSIENARRTFGECAAKYVAFCEGDDYWTNPCKLQKQVDFLKRNPDCSWCFHPATVLYADGSGSDFITRPRKIAESDRYTIKDILLGADTLAQTASVVILRDAINLPEWFFTAPVGDYYLFLIASTNGKAGYLPEVMSAYRRFVKGSWTESMKALDNKLTFYREHEKYLHIFNEYTGYKYDKYVKRAIINYRCILISHLTLKAPGKISSALKEMRALRGSSLVNSLIFFSVLGRFLRNRIALKIRNRMLKNTK